MDPMIANQRLAATIIYNKSQTYCIKQNLSLLWKQWANESLSVVSNNK